MPSVAVLRSVIVGVEGEAGEDRRESRRETLLRRQDSRRSSRGVAPWGWGGQRVVPLGCRGGFLWVFGCLGVCKGKAMLE